jgi:hypothetical protein
MDTQKIYDMFDEINERRETIAKMSCDHVTDKLGIKIGDNVKIYYRKEPMEVHSEYLFGDGHKGVGVGSNYGVFTEANFVNHDFKICLENGAGIRDKWIALSEIVKVEQI